MKKAKGEVIGMHPLFSPTTDHQSETVILCPARAPKATVQSLQKLLHSMKLKTAVMSAREHDELMAFVQAIPPFKSLLMAGVLKGLNADLKRIVRHCTPTYEIEFNVIGRFLDDVPELYMPIIFENPATLRALKYMRRLLNQYIAIATKRNVQSASRRYRALKNYFGPLTARARRHSEACIRTLSSLPS